MRKLKDANVQPKFITMLDGTVIYRMNRATLRKMAEEAGALVKAGRMLRINTVKFEEYLNSL